MPPVTSMAPEAEAHYESQRKRRRPPKPKVQPPLTPMIDCVFQLLLFFLISSSFRDEGIIPGAIPEVGKGASRDEKKVLPVYLIVRQTGSGDGSMPFYRVKVWQEGQDISPGEGNLTAEQRRNQREQMAQELFDKLAGLKTRINDPNMVLIIKPEVNYSGPGDKAKYAKYVRWQYVSEAYAQASKVEFKAIGFHPQTGIDEGA